MKKKYTLQLGLVMVLMAMTSYIHGQTTYTFTNATATGGMGPTQAMVNAAYTATTLAGAVTITTQGIQEWVVPSSGNYSIQALGAAGGGINGGLGASIYGEFALTAGQVLQILVGQQGTNDGNGSGGGGGSYAVFTGTPFIVAGGGGGNNGVVNANSNGQVGQNGQAGMGTSFGPGGTAGNQGISTNRAQGGAGWLQDGPVFSQGTTNSPAMRFLNGGNGGFKTGGPGGLGGFGGGGGSWNTGFRGSAGGGGYSGGGTGTVNANNNLHYGGGAGSFNSGTSPTNLAGINLGMGSVIISSLCAATIMPTISCPANITASNDVGACGATVTFTTPNGVDDCGSSTAALTAGLASGAVFPVGITTNTYTFTNTIGTVSCSFTVTVADTQAPLTACPSNRLVNNDAGICGAVVTYPTPIGIDNCSGATTALTSGLASGSTFPIGVSTVIYTATDSAGNAGPPCSFTVTVVDTSQPTITCLDSVITCDAIVMGIAPLSTGANCAGSNVTYTLSGATTGSGTTDASGTTFNIGITTVQYLITNAAGDVDSCSFNVQVDNCVGIDENKSLNNVSIYPNPTNGLVQINIGNHNGTINYTISTIEGRIVNQEKNVTTNNMTVDLSNESKGIYFLKIEDNTSSKVYKIIRK